MSEKKIAVIGAGTWGTALTRMLSNSGHEVTVWSALPAEIDELERTRRQKNLLLSRSHWMTLQKST